ncbi:MAG: DUF1328 domain-containing protein [Nitrospira sp.]|nr:DUF1328 domain-containing protein [Nitrospira sp.]
MYFMWAAIFFLIAIVAGAFGFTNIAADASEIGRILFYLSLTVFLLILLSGLFIFNKVKRVLPKFDPNNSKTT